MKTVGIRELKDTLSQVLRAVRDGEAIIVTDRGVPIAEIGPPGHLAAGSPTSPLASLIRRGLVRPKVSSGRYPYKSMKPVLRGVTSAELLAEDRGDR